MARTPPPSGPAPLERQLAAIQANGGRPLARAELAGLQPAAPATAVRMVATAGPVVNAAALPRGPLPGRPASRPQGSAAATPQPGLIERERALQHSRVTTAPSLPNYPPPAAVHHDPADVPPSTAAPPVIARTTTAPPAWRAEHPTTVETRPSPPQRGALAPDDPARASGRPPALPVFRPPGAGAVHRGIRLAAGASSGGTSARARTAAALQPAIRAAAARRAGRRSVARRRAGARERARSAWRRGARRSQLARSRRTLNTASRPRPGVRRARVRG